MQEYRKNSKSLKPPLPWREGIALKPPLPWREGIALKPPLPWREGIEGRGRS